MRNSRILNLIMGIVLIALVGVTFSGIPVQAEKVLASDTVCQCGAHMGCMDSMRCAAAGSSHKCVNLPAPSGCGCKISAVPDTDQIPSVVPHDSRDQDTGSLVALMPVKLESTDQPRYVRGYIAPEWVTYKFLHSSSVDGRSPPV